MALNLTEANAVQSVMRHLTGQLSCGAPISRAQTIDDLVHLVDHAYQPLHRSGQPAYTADEARTLLEGLWPVPTAGRATSPVRPAKPRRGTVAALPKCARCHVIRAEAGDLCVYCANDGA
jgi:hypothetical protein